MLFVRKLLTNIFRAGIAEAQRFSTAMLDQFDFSSHIKTNVRIITMQKSRTMLIKRGTMTSYSYIFINMSSVV